MEGNKQLQDLLVVDFMTQAITNVTSNCSAAVTELSLVTREATMKKGTFYATFSLPVGVH